LLPSVSDYIEPRVLIESPTNSKLVPNLGLHRSNKFDPNPRGFSTRGKKKKKKKDPHFKIDLILLRKKKGGIIFVG
jgi:hypothetical protein